MPSEGARGPGSRPLPEAVETTASGVDRRLGRQARHHGAIEPAAGFALVLVVVISAVLAALGLGAMEIGAMETTVAREDLAGRRAAFAAEAGLRAVKHWFDAPAGSAGAWRVPTPADVDRTRRRLDDDGDGAYRPYDELPPPWNVVYRQGSDDLFERPYEGSPAHALEGNAEGPDLLLTSETGSPSAGFLSALSTALFSSAEGPGESLAIARIAVYAPPSVGTGAGQRRLGIASIEVTAELRRRTGEGGRVAVASAAAGGVLAEIPYRVPGPLVAEQIDTGSGLEASWGTVLVAGAVGGMTDPRALYGGGWPWRDHAGRLVRDADGDGTGEDVDLDGRPDLDEWLGLDTTGLADPWFRLLAGGSLAGAPGGGTEQPYPFDPGLIPGPYATPDDRSGLFQNLGERTGAGSVMAGALDWPTWRAVGREGGMSVRTYRYVEGSFPPVFEDGSGIRMAFEEATSGKTGLFVFDTSDGDPPRDANGDGTAENQAQEIVVGSAGWTVRGCVVLNAASFVVASSVRSLEGPIAPPGEPCADLDRDGTCGEDDPFLRLDYPPDALAPGARFHRGGMDAARSGIVRRESGPEQAASVTQSGLFLVAGDWRAGPGVLIHGAVASGGVAGAWGNTGIDPPRIVFDPRLARGRWPPPDLPIPRTVWRSRWSQP